MPDGAIWRRYFHRVIILAFSHTTVELDGINVSAPFSPRLDVASITDLLVLSLYSR